MQKLGKYILMSHKYINVLNNYSSIMIQILQILLTWIQHNAITIIINARNKSQGEYYTVTYAEDGNTY